MSTTSSLGYVGGNYTETGNEDLTANGLGSASSTTYTVKEFGDVKHHVTEINFGTPSTSTTTVSVPGAGQQYVSLPLYVLPVGGRVSFNAISINVGLQAAGGNTLDTPWIGAGWVFPATSPTLTNIGEGTVVKGQAADCNGTVLSVVTGTGQWGVAADSTIALNISDVWTGADTITVSGTVTIEWTNLEN